jgi:hypothetical protein
MVIKKTSPVAQMEHGVIAVLDHAQPLRELIDRLVTAGVSLDHIAFMAKESEEQGSELLQKDGRSEGSGMIAGGVTGALAGLGALAIPGFGVLILAGGPLLAGALALAGGMGGVGLGAIIGAIFEEHVVKGHREIYQEHLAAGRSVLVVEGTVEEVALAEGVLKTVPTQLLDVF